MFEPFLILIAFASGLTFLLFGGISGWPVIVGLIIGGVVAASIGAYFVNKIPRKPITVIVGILIIYFNKNIIEAFF